MRNLKKILSSILSYDKLKIGEGGLERSFIIATIGSFLIFFARDTMAAVNFDLNICGKSPAQIVLNQASFVRGLAVWGVGLLWLFAYCLIATLACIMLTELFIMVCDARGWRPSIYYNLVKEQYKKDKTSDVKEDEIQKEKKNFLKDKETDFDLQ